MSIDYRESHLDPGKGETYHRRFRETPHRAMLWDMERRVLDDIIGRSYDGSFSHLDFACGTGRVLQHIAERAESSVGVDVSPSMLDVARRVVPAAHLLEADITRKDVLVGRSFDLITAFRFFPNAQQQLRYDVMVALHNHLHPGGLLVFNNHLNASSSFMRLAHLAGRGRHLGMAQTEVEKLVARTGFEIIETHHLGILPSNDRYLFIPLSMVRIIESWAFRHGLLKVLAQNVIFVCRSVRA